MNNYLIGCHLFVQDVTLLCLAIKGLKGMVAIVKNMPERLMLNLMGNYIGVKGKVCRIGTNIIEGFF